MKKILGVIFAAFMILSIAMFAACGDNDQGKNAKYKGKIVINGSTSVEPVLKKLIGKYIEITGVYDNQFEIAATGSSTGISTAMEGTVDFGMVSRDIKDNEKVELLYFELCKDGIAIIINKSNPIDDLTTETIKDIYKGTKTKFNDFDTKNIFVIARDASSGTRGAFQDIFGLKDLQDSNFGAIEAGTNAVITKVQSDLMAIGYISLGSLNSSVKAVKVDGVAATAENVKNNTYKVARPFVMVVNKNKELSEFAKDFQQFLLSKQAQDIIAAEKYISVVENAAEYKKSL